MSYRWTRLDFKVYYNISMNEKVTNISKKILLGDFFVWFLGLYKLTTFSHADLLRRVD